MYRPLAIVIVLITMASGLMPLMWKDEVCRPDFEDISV